MPAARPIFAAPPLERSDFLTEPFYTSRSRLEVLGPLHRRAHLEAGAVAELGVHGAIRELFRLDPERELPLPVDYIVAAAAG